MQAGLHCFEFGRIRRKEEKKLKTFRRDDGFEGGRKLAEHGPGPTFALQNLFGAKTAEEPLAGSAGSEEQALLGSFSAPLNNLRAVSSLSQPALTSLLLCERNLRDES